ncbi:unnamed protein product, partial [Laminaria digitata]
DHLILFWSSREQNNLAHSQVYRYQVQTFLLAATCYQKPSQPPDPHDNTHNTTTILLPRVALISIAVLSYESTFAGPLETKKKTLCGIVLVSHQHHHTILALLRRGRASGQASRDHQQ